MVRDGDFRTWQEKFDYRFGRYHPGRENQGGSVGAGGGAGIVFFPFCAPLAALGLYPLCLWGAVGTEFVADQLRYAMGAEPWDARPIWQGMAIFVVGFAGFRLDDRLGNTQPWYFLRHVYRVVLWLALFVLAGAREATGMAWPGVRELAAWPFQNTTMLVICVVYAWVLHRLARSDYMRRTWDYLLKFYRLRPREHQVLYMRGDRSFVPFRSKR